MRFTVVFTSEKALSLPLSYNEVIQGVIYRSLAPSLGSFLHDRGFSHGKRIFRLFTFSRLMGRVVFHQDSFEAFPPLRLTVSSPYDRTLQGLAENLVRCDEIRLNGNRVHIESINVHFTPRFSDSVKIRMLSPVTVYSTLTRADGSKKTYYYNPFEEEFAELIRANIIKKYRALYGRAPLTELLSIEPLRVSRKDEKIIRYRGFIIKGWLGSYMLKGDPELIKLAYDAGIGSKNSQGFGCFEVE